MLTKTQVGVSMVIAGLMAPGAASAAVVESVSVGANTATLGTSQSAFITAFGSVGSQCVPLAADSLGVKIPGRIHCSTTSIDADFVADAAAILRTTDRQAAMNGVRIGTSERALKRKVSGLRCRISKEAQLFPVSKHAPAGRTCTAGPSVKNRPGTLPPTTFQVNNSYALRATKAHPKRFKVSGFQLVKRNW